METLEADETGIGGMKSVNFMVTGAGAYSVLKYESGVHRVQRVPETESQGRIQTSTCSVAVMPEAEEVEVHIDDKDIRIDVMRASGNGGQCVNTTDSAVRLTHYPDRYRDLQSDRKITDPEQGKGFCTSSYKAL